MAQDWLADVRKYAADADDAVVGKLVRYLGIALRNRDSSLVSFGDAKETGRVRANFLKKKLGLTQSDEALDAAIAAVGERMKGDRTKNRVTVYYLLAEHFDVLDVFGGVKHGVTGGTAKAAAPKKAATVKKAPAAKAPGKPTKAAAVVAPTAPAAKAPKAAVAKPAATKTTAKPATVKAAAPKAAVKPVATAAAAPAKPKAAKASVPKISVAKATLTAPAAAEPAAPPPPPPPPPPPVPPTPAPPITPDAGPSGALAAANLGNGDDGARTGAAKGGDAPGGGGSRWWVWVLAILALAAIYFFLQSRQHEPAPKPGWDANLSADLNATAPAEDGAADNAALDNAVDDALANDTALTNS